MQEHADPLSSSKAEATDEVDDARTFSVVRNRRGSRGDAMAELTEGQDGDWDSGDGIWSLLLWLERLNCDGMSLRRLDWDAPHAKEIRGAETGRSKS